MDTRKKASPVELRLMVVGSSGPSQFQLTNSILGREEFPPELQSLSGSRKSVGRLGGRPAAVVNGPNIYDEDMSAAKREMELRRSKCLCIPGPHAFLVAFHLDAISPNDMRTPRLMVRRFGRRCLRHCVVLLACDGGREAAAALEERLEKSHWHLRQLVDAFGGRFHVFCKDWRQQGARPEAGRPLLLKLERMVASLGGAHFSSRTFQKAQDCVSREERRLRKRMTADNEKAWSRMEKRGSAAGAEPPPRKDAYSAAVAAEIRAKAETDNGWLRTSRARGLGTGAAVGAALGALVGAIEGPGGMVLYGMVGGALGGSAGGAAQVAIERMEDRVAPPSRLNFNSIFINRFFAAPRQ